MIDLYRHQKIALSYLRFNDGFCLFMEQGTGQTTKCSYIHLITRGTVEVNIYRALAGYSDFSEKLFVEYMNEYRRTYTK